MGHGNSFDPRSGPAGPAPEMFCPKCGRSYPGGPGHCPQDGARLFLLSDGSDDMVGRNLDGRFTIGHCIGRGGMGTVYSAVQNSTGRAVAVKVIRPEQASSRDAAKRFLREAQLSTELSSPQIITVFDFGRSPDGTLYFAMELLEGRNLGDVLAAEGALAPERVVRIGLQLCEALRAAHAKAIIHRDLKPANIVLLDDPRGADYIKVLDFGLAKSLAGDTGPSLVLTRTDALIGTPIYASPEMVGSGPVGPATDLYALGVILYELSTGTLPFSATTVVEMVQAHLAEPPRPLPASVPPGLRRVIERLLQKNPANRYASAIDVRDALAFALVPDPPALAPSLAPSPAVAPAKERGRRRLWPWLVAGLVVVVAAGAASFILAGQGTAEVGMRDFDGDVPAVVATADAGHAEQALDAAPRRAIVTAVDAGSTPVDARASSQVVKRRPRRSPKIDFVLRSEPPGARIQFRYKSDAKWVGCSKGERVCRFKVPARDETAQLSITKKGHQGLVLLIKKGRLSKIRQYVRTYRLEPQQKK